MFTYYTIIGKDINLLKGHVHNIKEVAGFDKIPDDKEFLVIVYKNKTIPESVTSEILQFCKDNGIRTVIYDEPTSVFLNNLYACWNLGYEHAQDGLVFRGGSDQVFNRDGIYNMYLAGVKYKVGQEKVFLNSNTVESPRAQVSRHIMKDFGLNFETFKSEEFESLCSDLMSRSESDAVSIHEALNIYGKPTGFRSSLGSINRTDGCSWLLAKSDWLKYGPIPTIVNGITGDVIILDRLTSSGYKDFIVTGSITYHFVRGESNDKY